MNKKIIFRADGNAEIGLGHLYRLISITEMLKNDYDFLFVTKSSSSTAILPKNITVQTIPDAVAIVDEPSWLESNFSPKEYLIIADGYQFNASYQKHLKALKYQLVYIDDLVEKNMHADIIINHAPSAKTSDYYASKAVTYGLGTKFALLRPAFLMRAKTPRAIKAIDTALVCFGGADKLNLSLKATKALLQTNFTKTIHIILGQAYTNNEILGLNVDDNKNIHIHRNLSENELAKVMSSCNFAIAPTSTILYELCCVKMPIIGGYYVENQRQIYEAMVQEKVILGAGDFSNYSVAEFKSLIEKKLEGINPSEYVARQAAIFDGKSDKRIIGLINALNITFRLANETDLQRTYNWSNDEMVRKNSYHSNEIVFEEHRNWFSSKISNANTLFLIVLVNNKPAGIVRYENNTLQSNHLRMQAIPFLKKKKFMVTKAIFII